MDYPDIHKYLSGEATEEEVKEIFRWLDADPANREAFFKVKKMWALKSESQEDHGMAWVEVQDKIRSRQRKKLVTGFLKYAAVIAGLVLSVQYFVTRNSDLGHEIPTDAITLRLDNGDIKVINEDGTSDIYNGKGVKIAKKEDEVLSYAVDDASPTTEKIEKLIYNHLWVPYGKTFQLRLSDGTKVRLNAGTSISYPEKFLQEGERKVFIKGEAFFEVAKDSLHPFIVDTDKMAVKVLGTTFNVSSYPDDTNVTAVLVEGAVHVYDEEAGSSSQNSKFLQPGQKAEWNENSENISIEEVDPSIYTAWTTGKIVFRNTPFKDIRKILERHYNVKIHNNDTVLDKKTYNATFDVESINQVLATFNESYPINYTIKNDEVIIN